MYERAIARFPVTHVLWLQYAQYTEQHLAVPKVVNAVYARAVRNCPWVGVLWARYSNPKCPSILSMHRLFFSTPSSISSVLLSRIFPADKITVFLCAPFSREKPRLQLGMTLLCACGLCFLHIQNDSSLLEYLLTQDLFLPCIA